MHGSEEVSAASEEVCAVMMSTVRAMADGAMSGERIDQLVLDHRRTSQAVLVQVRADLDIA